MRIERLVQVNIGLGNKLLELGNLANFFEGEDFILLVAIDGKSCRIIATILEAGETCSGSSLGNS
jgi:hypothetical protein